MRDLLKYFSFGVLIFVCFVNLSNAQVDSDERWWNGISESWDFDSKNSKDEIAIMQNRWKSIEEENKNNKFNEWVGDYFVGGETHGMYLRWSPQNGFVILEVDKCAAQVRDFSYGKISTTPNLVQFTIERSMKKQHSHASEDGSSPNKQKNVIWVQVKFNGSRLLIPETQMSDFGDYVAGLGRYNSLGILYFLETDFFYQLNGEEIKDNTSSPIIPSGYEHFLKAPITGKITAITKREIKKGYSYEDISGEGETFLDWVSLTYVTVNIGKSYGVKKGFSFRIINTDERVKLIQVGKEISTGIIIRDLDEYKKETYIDSETNQTKTYPKVSVGWKLTTSSFKD